jgi:cell division protein FtsA
MEIEKSGKNPVCGSGIVLTGGGALLKGIRAKTQRFLNMPVRIGKPEHNLCGLEKFEVSPVYSSAVGLAGFGLLERKKQGDDFLAGPGMLDGINKKMKTWFKDLM